VKALTLWQPWATLVAIGAKHIETRSWPTQYRGPIAIHAAKHFNTPRCTWEEPFKSELAKAGMFSENGGFKLKHNGCVIAIADLVDCVKVLHSDGMMAWLENGYVADDYEYPFGDYSEGRYGWILANVRPIHPVRVNGRQRLWNWEPECAICGNPADISTSPAEVFDQYIYCGNCLMREGALYV
jgi:hypothetical protein